MICADELREILTYDNMTGVFTRRVMAGHIKAGSIAGNPDKDGYLRVCLKGGYYKCHRLAWLYMYGEWPDGEVDHINGIRTDNRVSNLRVVSRKENMKNAACPKTNTSGFIGVTWDKSRSKWAAKIMVDQKCLNLGRFDSIDEAISARQEAELKYAFHQNHGRPPCNKDRAA